MDRLDIISKLSAIVKEDIRSDINMGIEKTSEKYLQTVNRELYMRVTYSGRRSLLHRMTDKDIKALWEDIKPELTEMIDNYIQACKKRKMTKDIKATAAQAVIKEAMEEAGLKFNFQGQAYRAKLFCPICKNRSLIFYITYSKLYEQLPEVIKSLKLIKEGMKGLGENVTVNKTYDNII